MSPLGGFFNQSAANSGVWGPAAMGVVGAVPGGAKPKPSFPGGFDPSSMIAQILQQGPQPDQSLLSSSLSDIDAEQNVALNTLKNRFSGSGRPLASTEYGSQESELINAFSRARSAARANASRAGMQNYTTQLNPLMLLLRSMQEEGPVFTDPAGAQSPGRIGGIINMNQPRY